jgi:hypothetical protein
MLVYQRAMDMNGTYNQQYSGIVLDCSQNDDFFACKKDDPMLIYPQTNTAIEHGHRNSGFTY